MKKLPSQKVGRRYLRLLLSALLSFIMTINVPALAGYDMFSQNGPTDYLVTQAAEQSLSSLRGEKARTTKPSAMGGWEPVSVLLNDDITIEQPSTQQTLPTPLIAQSNQSLLLEGINLYRAEQFSAAIDTWKQALNTSATEDLNQALLLNNLSLAYQQLGQLDNADKAISQSRLILKGLADSANASADYWETVGKALNTQGKLQWTRGDIESALATWQNATTAYNQAGHERGIVLSLINQAKALQTLGRHLQAKTILKDYITQHLQTTQLDAKLQATSLWQLANAQRQFGQLKDSETYLQKSLEIIDNNPELANLHAPVLLDLGNTERALGNRASAINKKRDAKRYQESALAAYQEAASSTLVPKTQLQAELNQLSLLIDLEQWTDAETLWPDVLSDINLPPSRSAIYARLNFAHSLTNLMQAATSQANGASNVSASVSPLTGAGHKASTASETITIAQSPKLTWQTIDNILDTAIQESDSLNDSIAKSYAMGQRGTLYETTGQWQQAEDFTQRALQLTTTNAYPDGRYRWQWQQGRLLKKQNKQEEAIVAYDAAVETLDGIRSNLRFIDAEVQFSFRDNVEPIYREFAELLLIREDGSEPEDVLLDKAIKQIDSLQLSELENFLRCSLAKTTAITKFEAASNTAILYPMILENHLTVILQLADGKRFHKIDIPNTEVEKTLADLRVFLSESPSDTPDVIPLAKKVYGWLIEPFIDDITSHGEIDTLVFVLDGSLRNIPMGVLFDGQEFLIQKYAIAVAPELELFTPQPLPEDLQVFTGGVGEGQMIGDRTFEPIEKLDAELDVISELFGPQPPLVNEQFQGQVLQEQLSTGNFSGIHLKTHGVFSSDPDETFIVAYEELLQGDELGALIQAGSRQGATPIEMLVLSACSTATGDNRAVLGLAGIAVRAGARSTVSTLWEAQDTPNTQLMIKFYEELKQTGTSRAAALRQAQLFLINNVSRAPHIWATYVLVGNWL
ncbi:MAG: CHAT domain-containing protein [Leptolyngbya sp. SIO3F4]|nr:CHAT domain-containing protein [Leptolyngbya sp. SIO3F4]